MEIKTSFNLVPFEKLGAIKNNELYHLREFEIPLVPFNEILYTYYQGNLTAFKIIYWAKVNCYNELWYLIEFPNQERVWLYGFINKEHPIYKFKDDFINDRINNTSRNIKIKFHKTGHIKVLSSHFVDNGNLYVTESNLKYVIGTNDIMYIGLSHREDRMYFNRREDCMQYLLNGMKVIDFAPIHQPTLFDTDDTFIQKSITRTIKIVEITSKKQML